MKRIVMFPFGLAAAVLLSVWVLGQDLRQWWAWRREDRRGKCKRELRSCGVPGEGFWLGNEDSNLG